MVEHEVKQQVGRNHGHQLAIRPVDVDRAERPLPAIAVDPDKGEDRRLLPTIGTGYAPASVARKIVTRRVYLIGAMSDKRDAVDVEPPPVGASAWLRHEPRQPVGGVPPRWPHGWGGDLGEVFSAAAR